MSTRIILSSSSFRSRLFQRQRIRAASTKSNVSEKTVESSSSETNLLPWRLCAAMLVERVPLITPPLDPIQEEMRALLRQLEIEESYKSEHELRAEEDAKRKESEDRKVVFRYAADDEDAWKAELKEFQPASRRTEADEKNNVRSIHRALDRPLRLMVKQKFGDKRYIWTLPITSRVQGETMRVTAERALTDVCGMELDVAVLGNAPWGFFKQKYPKKVQDLTSHQGDKVFIYKAHLNGGKIDLNKDLAQDYSWALIEELKEKIERKQFNAFNAFLWKEGNN